MRTSALIAVLLAALPGTDRSGEFSVVDVWTKDGDAWKLRARHLGRPDSLKR